MYPPLITHNKVPTCHQTRPVLLLLCVLAASLLLNKPAEASNKDNSRVQDSLQVVVNTHYINMHTGPGRGYPIFHSLEKGETITLLKSKTDWIKVVTAKGVKGWIHRKVINNTVGTHGQVVKLGIPERGDYSDRRWEIGVSFGEFESIPSIGIHGAYRITPNISAELRYNQATGRSSNSKLYSWGFVHQPFPEKRLSPFFTLANGELEISPNANLSQTQDQQDNFFMVGVGTYFYLSHRFMARLEYNNYTTLPDRDNNENIDEWKLGLSAFF